MRAIVHGIEAHDIQSWPNWSAPDPLNVCQWFTVTIGPENEIGVNLFQVAVATPLGIKSRRIKEKYVGLVVDHFGPVQVERAIKEFVSASVAPSWDAIVDLLRAKMRWEYEGMGEC